MKHVITLAIIAALAACATSTKTSPGGPSPSGVKNDGYPSKHK